MDFSQIPEGHEDGEEPLIFHYDKAERVRNAPQIVKDYYDGKLIQKRPGLFKALVATRSNRLIFIALMVCFALVVFNMFFGPKPNVETRKGVPMTLAAFSYDGSVLVSLEFDDVWKIFAGKYSGGIPVFAKFEAVDVDNQVVGVLEDAGLYEERQLFLRARFTDFDIASVNAEVVLKFGGEENSDGDSRPVVLKAKVERR